MTTKNRQGTVDTSEPIVCTMPADEVPEQLYEWSDLQREASEVTAIKSGVRMRLPASMADQVAGLIRREAACCAFLTLNTAIEAETLTLEVTAENPDALPVISALAGIDIT